MLDFFTRLLTPVFITLGLVEPTIKPLPEIQPIIREQVEVIPEIIIEDETVLVDSTVTEKKVLQQPTPILEVSTPSVEPVVKKTVVETPVTSKPAQPVVVQTVTEELIEVIEPKCGTSEKMNFETAPLENLCSSGVASEVTQQGDDKFKWVCSTEEEEVSCKSYREVAGVCGPQPRTILESDFDSDILCKEGSESSLRIEDGNLSWRCNGTHKAEDAYCTALIDEDGVCGGVAGTCNQGDVINKSTSGNITSWQCSGFYGGSNDSCSYSKPTVSNITETKEPSQIEPFEIPEECKNLPVLSQALCVSGGAGA